MPNASPHFTWNELDPLNLADPVARQNLVGWCTAIGEPVRAHFGKWVNVTSGYRSFIQQTTLWEAALRKYGSEALAREHVAPPGHSEHETGHACDIWIEGVKPSVVAAFCATLPGCGGIGVYKSWTHADTRFHKPGIMARW